jgi:hypothetical protein
MPPSWSNVFREIHSEYFLFRVDVKRNQLWLLRFAIIGHPVPVVCDPEAILRIDRHAMG